MKYFWEKVKTKCSFKKLKEFSEKAFLETSYHSKYASQWVVTLGDGTDESNLKMSTAVANLEPFLGELFNNDDFTEMCSQNDFLPKPTSIFDSWKNEVEAILQKGNLGFPDIILKKRGGRKGEHSEVFGYLLSDLQYMQRAYPNSSW